MSILEKRQRDTNPDFKPEVANVIIYGRLIPLGVVLIEYNRGWVFIEGEQFAVKRRSMNTWEIVQ